MTSKTGATLTYRLYAALANLAAPLAFRNVSHKLAEAGVPPARRLERMGHAGLPRPQGPLIWCHAASVGEALSALTLIKGFQAQHPDLHFLITSGTATSAALVAKQLPPQTQHQFAPLDSRRALTRFLTHWTPDLAVFVESELWPQMIVHSARHGVPLALLNARLSKGSLRNWGKFPQTARFILSRFAMIRTQDDATLRGLLDLGADPSGIAKGQNLKSAADPLPVDQEAQARLQTQIAGRPVWCAASTHPGEEAHVLRAHSKVLAEHPEALLILAPRHPERRAEVAKLIAQAGLSHSTRSAGDAPVAQVYLADTLGEMGLWYSLCPQVFVAGSFTDVGGHNPFEPAQAGAAVLHGPLFANFAEAYAEFATAGGASQVADAEALAAQIHKGLSDPAYLRAEREKARAFAQAQSLGLDQIVLDLSKLLKAV